MNQLFQVKEIEENKPKTIGGKPIPERTLLPGSW